MKSKFDVTTAHWKEVKDRPYDLAFLPWGATEPHNLHLPYGTDSLMARAIACMVAEQAAERGVRSMVFPMIPLGSQNPGQVELPFCIHTSQETQFAVLRDIVRSLKHQGIHRLIIMSGHGGNVFKGIIRDMVIEDPSMTILQAEWFSFLNQKDYFEEKDDHAGEMETSAMMYCYPEYVLPLEEAGEGKSNPFNIEGLNRKVAWIPRDWSRVSYDTGVGNPKKASAEKGKKYVTEAVRQLTDLVVDLVNRPVYKG